MITLYTKDNCVQCKATERLLKQLGIKYLEINIEHNEKVRERLKSMNIKQMPALFRDGKFLFSGFQPSEVKKLVNDIDNYMPM